MSCKSFSNGKLLDHFAKTLDTSPRVPNETGALYKIRHAQRRKASRRAVPRQDVARAGKIVADNCRRISADEDCAGIVDPVGNVIGFRHEYLDMFRSDVIDEFDGLVFVTDDKSDSSGYRGTRDGFAVQDFKLGLEFN